MSYGLKLLVPCALALYLVAACQPDLDSLSASYTGDAGNLGSAGNTATAGTGSSDGGMSNGNGGSAPVNTCENNVKDSGETDVDCGGDTKCERCARGSKCKKDEDCEDEYCKSLICTKPTCFDNVQNNGETAVDCGGANCDACDLGAKCDENRDCTDDYCADGLCADHCTSGLTDGDETGPDCGGDSASCERCAAGITCNEAADCQSQICSNRKCVAASCTDGLKNQDESAVDCGGACSAVGKGCDLGIKCNGAADCTSWVCSPTSHLCLADPVVVEPTALIDDFEDGDFNLPSPSLEGRVGNWYPFSDGTGTASFDLSNINRGASKKGFTTKGKDYKSWGSGVGIDMLGGKKPYDASKYTGVTFWARANLAQPADPLEEPVNLSVTVAFPDVDTDPGGMVCTTCDHHYYKGIQVSQEWQRFTLKFADLLAEGGTVPIPTAFKPNGLIAVQFRMGGGTTYELYLDDLAFVQ